MSEDDNSELAEKQWEREREKLFGKGKGSDGGPVVIRDPRVSKGLNTFWGVIAVLLVTVLGFCANNLWQLNLTMRDVLADKAVTVSTLSDHELRIRQLERSEATWEGRNMRGSQAPVKHNDEQ